MPSSVPSPPSTTTRSTSPGSSSRARVSAGRGPGSSAAVSCVQHRHQPARRQIRRQPGQVIGRRDQVALGDDADARDGWGSHVGRADGSGGRSQVEEELDVALLSRDRRRGRGHVGQSYLSGRGHDVANHAIVHRRIAHDALGRVGAARPRTAASPAPRCRRRAGRRAGSPAGCGAAR